MAPAGNRSPTLGGMATGAADRDDPADELRSLHAFAARCRDAASSRGLRETRRASEHERAHKRGKRHQHDHAHGSGHGHGHGHSHDHSAVAFRRLAVAFGITATLLVAEVIGAFWTGSLALLTDAGHMLTDTIGLGMALLAARLMLLPPTDRRTWGFARAEVLSAGVQAGILLIVGLYTAVEGVRRLFEPAEVPPGLLLVFGVVGLAGNLVSMAVLAGGRHANLNLRAAFLEVVNDALGSVAVIVGAIVIATTGWLRADALAGLFIAALILPRAVRILREAVSVLLESAPRGLEISAIRAHILSVECVLDVHDIHVSRIATNMPVLTAHVVVEDRCFTEGSALDVLDALQECVASHFPIPIEHSTFQLEPARHREHEGNLGH